MKIFNKHKQSLRQVGNDIWSYETRVAEIIGKYLYKLKWEVDDFAWITREICNLARDYCSSRVVSVLEGGYNLDALAACTKAHIENLIEAN